MARCNLSSPATNGKHHRKGRRRCLTVFLRDASWTWPLRISPLGPPVVTAEIPDDPSASPLHLSSASSFSVVLPCRTEYISALFPGPWVRCPRITVILQQSSSIFWRQLIPADAQNLICRRQLILGAPCYYCFFGRSLLSFFQRSCPVHSSNGSLHFSNVHVHC